MSTRDFISLGFAIARNVMVTTQHVRLELAISSHSVSAVVSVYFDGSNALVVVVFAHLAMEFSFREA